MASQISAVVDDEVNEIIEELAEYHDISKSGAIEMLLREGTQMRTLRYRFEQLDAKMDLLISELGVSNGAPESLEERFAEVTKQDVPATETGVALADAPLPRFDAISEFPDRSAERKALYDADPDEDTSRDAD